MKSNVNMKKLKELIAHICKRNEENPRFGSVVLNKMLFFADFYWYAIAGLPITNDNYIRREWGPTPEHFLQARQELENENVLKIQNKKFFGKIQKRPVIISEYALEQITEDERKFVDFVIDRFESFTGKDISEATHTLPWQVSEDGDVIPYETVFASGQTPIPDSAMQWAKNALVERKSKIIREAKTQQISPLHSSLGA